MQAIGWAVVIIINVSLMIVTASFEGGGDCAENIPSWACGQAFQPIIEQAAGGLNILSLFTSIVPLLESLGGLIIFNYDLLSQDNIILGSIGFMLRISGVIFVSISFISVISSIVRR